MNLPFSIDQFLAVFERYNQAVWPLQFVFYLLALTAIWFTVRPHPFSDKAIAGILAVLWFWIGAVYHWTFFSTINPAAYMFGGLNIVQGAIFLFYGIARHRLQFKHSLDLHGLIAWAMIIYALVIYPVLGHLLGHGYPNGPTFGLPCPTTIFTFGILMWARPKVPRVLLVIPLIWSMIGFSAAITLGMREDIGLLVAGVVGTLMIYLRENNRGLPG